VSQKRTLDPQRAVGYVRVSTEEQNLGPEAQRKAMHLWCKSHDTQLVAVHEDLGVSGGAPLEKRPGLLAALDELGGNNAGVLLVAKRDRLARDVVVAAMVERLAQRQGARIKAADGTGNGTGPEAMLMRGIVDLFAQYERAVIRTRTRAALAVKKAKQERIGQVPYGYRLGADRVHLEPLEREQTVIQRVHSLKQEGLSIRAVAGRLNDENIPSRGTRWHPTTVARLLTRDTA
jgi:site-specific DNA recombinase